MQITIEMFDELSNFMSTKIDWKEKWYTDYEILLMTILINLLKNDYGKRSISQ